MNPSLRIVPLGGGPGHVTTNMYLYLWGNEGLIVDCGIGFPQDKSVDKILIPDITWLTKQQFKLHAILLTHGHDDHHAALPYILPKLGNLPIYASRLTAAFAKDRLQEFKLNSQIKIIQENLEAKLGPFTVSPIHVTHSVPDTLHFVINTPVGAIYHGSDFKFDLTPLDGRPPHFQKIVSLSKPGVKLLLSDCLRSERPGFSLSESALTGAIHREISHCPGRLIFTTMSSNIHRIQQAIDVASSHGRKVAFIGRSMERNVATAARLNLLKLLKSITVNKRVIKKIPDHRLCLIVAGSQGQETSSLTRYAEGSHRLIKARATDKVIFSSDIIPGNEQMVYQVIDQLSKKGVSVAYSDLSDDLHVSGHASAGEIQLLMELVKPNFLYPIGGSFRHMRQYQKLALNMGFRQNQVIIPDSGQIIELNSKGQVILGEVLKLDQIYIEQGVK